MASLGTGEYISKSSVTVSGFTKDSNSITAPYKMLAFVSIGVVISQYTGPCEIRVNGSEVVSLVGTGNYYYMIDLDAGDKVQVYCENANLKNSVSNFTMNGV